MAIVGAGSAGIAAAIGASNVGARTILIERYGFAGGAATTSSVLAYCGLFANTQEATPVVGGAALDVLNALERLGVDVSPRRIKSTGNWIIPLNPEALKIAIDRAAARHGIQILYRASLCDVAVAGGRIESIAVGGDFGVARIEAKAFIDASGEGNLWHLAGPSRRGAILRMQPASLPVRVGGVDRDWQTSRDAFRTACGFYNAQDPLIRARDNGGVVLDIPGSTEVWWMALDFETDPTDAVGIGQSEIAAREASWHLVSALRHVGGPFRNAYVASTGPQIGIRESRRPTTVGRVAAEEIVAGSVPDDTVALGGWPMEIHHSPGVQEYIHVGGKGFFGIALDALRVAGIANLLVAGRLIGADSKAFGSIRVMGTAFATGQAAGVSAAQMASSSEVFCLQDVRSALTAQGAILLG
ncbi:FAD-dependent oxidoreductase [Bosea sp. PAMC 26642]|uniref:FAD-dependent oxidoreductase n=1 Tax=Bosea sp. (strain PAMC 26642) TaxID=1792307 RepID=UPI000830E8DE|nr:FAD-dependent oxidoreductase [Bosea sp. PAMC 26642]